MKEDIYLAVGGVQGFTEAMFDKHDIYIYIYDVFVTLLEIFDSKPTQLW